MKHIISISAAALVTFLLAGCGESDVMHVGSMVAPTSSGARASSSSAQSDKVSALGDSVAQKHMENRTF